MLEIMENIRELADTLARIGQPTAENIETIADTWQPWLEFEPVNGLTYL